MTTYNVGTQYLSSGRHPRLCTVTDILKTYNSAGQLVRTRYVATHPGPMGQLVTDHDVCAVTIAKGFQGQRATDAEIREDLRDQIANSGDC